MLFLFSIRCRCELVLPVCTFPFAHSRLHNKAIVFLFPARIALDRAVRHELPIDGASPPSSAFCESINNIVIRQTPPPCGVLSSRKSSSGKRVFSCGGGKKKEKKKQKEKEEEGKKKTCSPATEKLFKCSPFVGMQLD